MYATLHNINAALTSKRGYIALEVTFKLFDVIRGLAILSNLSTYDFTFPKGLYSLKLRLITKLFQLIILSSTERNNKINSLHSAYFNYL